MTTLRTARERARSEITAEILTTARQHLERDGAAALSLRAVARDLGLVSSAVYRYFANRDELLTALIVESYDSLGDAAEAALHEHAAAAPLDRWTEVAVAIRRWALGHRHEYALLYGTPVPGYAAPDTTVAPGTRVSLALVQVVRDAHAAGRLRRARRARAAPDVGADLTAELEVLGSAIAPGVPAAALFELLLAWTQLFGLLSFELFGQTRGIVEGHERLFEEAARAGGVRIGL